MQLPNIKDARIRTKEKIEKTNQLIKEIKGENEIMNKKFTKEGLFKYSKYISEICSNNIDEICNILSQNEDDVYNYIEGEIG